MELRVAVEKRLGTFDLAVDFAVSGACIGLCGPSGAGKSTLVGLIAGMQRPDRGTLVLDGETLFSSERAIHCPQERRRIGIVLQQPHLFPHLDVRGNLLFGWHRTPPTLRRLELAHVAGMLQIAPLLGRRVHNLSGGEQQRVAIGRALLASPRLLLLDEPLAALDEPLRLTVMRELRAVCADVAIPYVYISHTTAEVAAMTTQIVHLAAGRLRDGTPGQTMQSDPMQPDPEQPDPVQPDPVQPDPTQPET